MHNIQKIGVFYGSSTGNTAMIARIIKEHLPEYEVDLFDVAHTSPEKIQEYKCLIFGVATWGNAEIQDDFSAFLQGFQKELFKSKLLALFGTGDQETYGNTFADGLGVLYEKMKPYPMKIIGQWENRDYSFESSLALQDDDTFVGLVLDEDNQHDMTISRIKQWCDQINQELKLVE
jgi:flavodoxin I